MSHVPTTAFVFDLGGVLIDWNPRYLYRKLFDDEQAMELFLRDVCSLEWNAHQDAGRPFREGVELLANRFPSQRPLIEAFFERWEEMVGGPIHGTVEILGRLRDQGSELYGLSNWSAETFPKVRNRFDFLGWFRHILVSGEFGARKPDPSIYREFVRRVGKPAQECLFIDDVEENVAAARRTGFQAIQFASPAQLEEELKRRSLL